MTHPFGLALYACLPYRGNEVFDGYLVELGEAFSSWGLAAMGGICVSSYDEIHK
jgi:hypothetical protein